MNRFKKEELKKRMEARKGLTPDEIKTLDVEEAEDKAVEELTRKIHAERFPEEYDFMFDSHVDVSDRRKGNNPMSDEYVAKVNEKRRRSGVSQLSENGMATSDDTMELCRQETRKEIEGKKGGGDN